MFAENLKYFRMREKLTQKELAAKLGISRSTIAMYENGNREPDFETLEMIADFFNINMSTLLGEKEIAPTVPSKSDRRRLLDSYIDDFTEAEIESLLAKIESERNM